MGSQRNSSLVSSKFMLCGTSHIKNYTTSLSHDIKNVKTHYNTFSPFSLSHVNATFHAHLSGTFPCFICYWALKTFSSNVTLHSKTICTNQVVFINIAKSYSNNLYCYPTRSLMTAENTAHSKSFSSRFFLWAFTKLRNANIEVISRKFHVTSI